MMRIDDLNDLEYITNTLRRIDDSSRILKYYRENPEKRKEQSSKWYKENGTEYHRNYYHNVTKKK